MAVLGHLITLQKLKPYLLSVLVLMVICSPANALNLDNLHDAEKSANVVLSAKQIQQLKAKKLTAALAWHGSSTWVSAVTNGAKQAFEELGIKVVAITDAQFDPAKQVADLENISAMNPDIILSLSVDSTSTKATYAQTISNGAKLVLLSNPIEGFVHGKDYAGIVTDDMFGMGKAAAELTSDALENNGKLGIIFHDANYFITNNRDQAFREAIQQYPHISVISEKGFVKEHETSNIAAAMVLQNPDLQAIYVSWDSAAEGVIEALRSLDRPDIKVITHDLGVNNLLDMATDGNLYATVADRPFDIGATMAKIGAGAILNKPAAPVTIVPFDKVTKHNIATVWQHAFKTSLPKLLNQALTQ
ncbi:sugar ABC transporter substrate-binding protein [Thalassotalea insulae]|uniref:Sugar ABC transporter substrate-binding protein n=1 Tax=Thalassotalea insulae TaxID=2056778 RepID=A0ABQ6GZY7_9GAMM|nr:substrate-binding domain-containing protein [Thalassotalea insulae]GLX79791.1 sugar ABC transporter substrate-binding protein [Thalassotalea insulae]